MGTTLPRHGFAGFCSWRGDEDLTRSMALEMKNEPSNLPSAREKIFDPTLRHEAAVSLAFLDTDCWIEIFKLLFLGTWQPQRGSSPGEAFDFSSEGSRLQRRANFEAHRSTTAPAHAPALAPVPWRLILHDKQRPVNIQCQEGTIGDDLS